MGKAKVNATECVCVCGFGSALMILGLACVLSVFSRKLNECGWASIKTSVVGPA